MKTIGHPGLSLCLRAWFQAAGSGVMLAAGLAAQVMPAGPSRESPTVVMDPLLVAATSTDEGYDETGMGGLESERIEPPFSNELLAGLFNPDEDLLSLIDDEYQAAAGISPVDLAAGVSRVDLRGFPTPRLRNGFTQSGIPEILNPERTELIQGPLTAVIGRGAPGGIRNLMTVRPRARVYRRFNAGLTTGDAWNVRYEATAPLVPKKAWYRLAGSFARKDGPQDLAFRKTLNLNGALTWKHSEAASTMVQVDFQELTANAAPGIPEYRPTRTGKVVGPYLPLAHFHSYGPNAGTLKRVASASVQYEAQVTPALSLRAGMQGFLRQLEEDRWTVGQFLLDTQTFGGTREPQRIEQPLRAFAVQIDGTLRFHVFGAEHKLTASAARSQVRYDRLQRGLDAAGRAELPADVRNFDPFAPNWFRPAYDPTLYRRVITDRTEATGYTTLWLTERAAFANGRFVATTGMRADFVGLELEDRRPGAVFPTVEDDTEQLTWHAGLNYLVSPSRLLVFVNASTAFQPSTRVDARTGHLQGNDTTRGLEVGAKGLFIDRKLSLTALGFAYANQNISRRNPLYNDPILDASLTQPELVAAGEEEFTGGTIDVRGQLSTRWTLSGRAAYTRAITTRSPGLPEEVGRPLTRVPRMTYGLQNRYQFTEGRWQGLSLGATMIHVSDYVHSYENASREYLAYPDYTLTAVNAGYRWKTGSQEHNIGVSCSNLLDRDLLTELARVGVGREVAVNYSLTF